MLWDIYEQVCPWAENLYDCNQTEAHIGLYDGRWATPDYEHPHILSSLSAVILYVVTILFPGDEVLQWNGKSLPGATKKEVYNIILESKAEPQVEIVVSRPIG